MFKLPSFTTGKLVSPKALGIAVIAIIWFLVVLANYEPGTWLIGWDNLLPELNFSLNIQRSIFASWQSFQGLGLEGGLAHAAELPRQIILLLMSLVLPTSLLRYTWTFLMLLIGPLGAFYLSNYFLREKFPAASLGAGIFYLLNLATVQYFYVPLETFSTFYGFLPWLLFSALKYLDSSNPKDLLKYFLLSIAATAAFHVQTLFIVYAITLGVFALTRSAALRTFKPVLLLAAVTLSANLFWLLPVLHFTVTNVEQTTESAQNLLSTPETQYINAGFGRLRDIALLKGYWFEYTDRQNGETVYLLHEWRQHFSSIFVKLLGYLMFLASSAGVIIFSLSRKSRGAGIALLALFLLSIAMLTGGHGILGVPFKLFTLLIPLFDQVFRVSFTKWSMVLALILSLGTGFFLAKIQQIAGNIRFKAFGLIAAVIISAILVLPVFSGSLIYDRVQTQLPGVYEELFAFFETQPKSARIAYLPINTIWGWDFNTWGYRGSGFIWYGIEQPILHRNFDNWSKANESFYREATYALESENVLQLLDVFKKYQVSYLLYDHSLQDPSSSENKILEDSGLIAKLGGIPVWQKDFLTVYDIRNLAGTAEIVAAPPAIFPTANEPLSGLYRDPIYRPNAVYIFDPENAEIQYPFAALADNPATPEYLENQVVLNSAENLALDLNNLVLPGLTAGTIYNTKASVTFANGEIIIIFEPNFFYKNGDQIVAPSALNSVRIPVPDEWNSVVVVQNETSVELQRGQTFTMWFYDLKAGEPFSIDTFNKADSQQENGTYFVIDRHVSSHRVGAESWNSLLTEKIIPLAPSSEPPSLIISAEKNSVQEELLAGEAESCDVFKRGKITKAIEDDKVIFRSEKRGAVCQGIVVAEANSHQSYLARFEGENKSGRSLKMYVENIATSHAVVESLLGENTFDVSFSLIDWPSAPEDLLWMHISDQSFGVEKTQNILTEVSLYELPVPISYLSNITLTKGFKSALSNPITVKKIKQHNPTSYEVELDNQTGGYITLQQAYDEGWTAYANGKELKHFPANSWSNAWKVEPGTDTLQIKYAPQQGIYLGYLVLLAGGVLVALIFRSNRH